MAIFLSTAYLAPIQYYSKLLHAGSDSVCIDQWENYQKQSYRNRCTILSANGAIPLSIPIERTETLKCVVKDVCIADHANWRHVHWNALVSAYNTTPFFEYYRDDFQPFYEKKIKYLIDYNQQMQSLICNLIGIDCHNIMYTESYQDVSSAEEFDFRNTIHPKKEWNSDVDFVSIPYYQVFEDRFGFIPNLSIVDLLFNMGNESMIVLNKTIR
ncbi:MAG: WbqC family protein [Dysgonomonas sp.]